ncbi:MAG: hypothetical protein ACI9OJ_005166, partial [Myxococcota bacterium]
MSNDETQIPKRRLSPVPRVPALVRRTLTAGLAAGIMSCSSSGGAVDSGSTADAEPKPDVASADSIATTDAIADTGIIPPQVPPDDVVSPQPPPKDVSEAEDAVAPQPPPQPPPMDVIAPQPP